MFSCAMSSFCFHDFSHGASLHPYSMIFALVPHFSWCAQLRACVRTYVITEAKDQDAGAVQPGAVNLEKPVLYINTR